MGRGLLPGALALVLLATATATGWAGCRTPVDVSGARPPLRPFEPDGRSSASAFFRAPLLAHLAISPDGRHIAAIASQGRRDTLVALPIEGGESRALSKIERVQARASWEIGSLGWGSDEKIVVSVHTPNPRSVVVRARRSRLLVVDLAGRAKYLGEDWPYQEYSSSQDDIASYLPGDPNRILINWWQPDQSGAGARTVNLHNGALHSVTPAHPNVREWLADHEERVRAGWGTTRDGLTYFMYAREREGDLFDEIIRFRPFEEDGFRFAAFSERPDRLYVWSERSGRLALYEYHLDQRRLGREVFGHPEFDADGLVRSERDGRLLAVSYADDRPRLHFVAADFAAEQRAIDAELPDATNRFVSWDAEERRGILHSSGDRIPPRYFLYDRADRSLRFLFEAYPELAELELAPMQRVAFEARDGLRIRGYLTVPPGAEPRDLPVVVLPHGGPVARDVWGWNPEVQFLASRGFAVFQLDFRGSRGYGRDHRSAGYGQFGLAMQDDITDGVRWLIDTGVADPERIGIYGVSYGGYAALMALAKTPELFRAGASFAGVTDLPSLLDDDSQYLAFAGPMEKLVGDRWRDRAALAALSPARQAERIRAPVLIAHGSDDWRVNMRHAEQMLDALEARDGEVEGLLYRGEVHGFLDERNAIDFYTRLGDFFAEHLAAAL